MLMIWNMFFFYFNQAPEPLLLYDLLEKFYRKENLGKKEGVSPLCAEGSSAITSPFIPGN